ncbi:MAG: dienelactone hydrolase family protein [Acidiferrobacterales bacterium]
MTRSRKHFLLALLGLTLVAFITKVDVIYAGEEELASLAATLSDTHFAYDKETVVQPSNHMEEKLETSKYRVRRLSFPSIGENGQDGNLVTGLYYQSKLPGKKKLVIVLPIWGTHTYPSRKMTKSLLAYSRGDMNVLRILGENFLFDWEAMRAVSTEEAVIVVARQMAERVQTHVIDIRRIVDWTETQPDIDPERVGLIGFSMGGLVGSLIMANEPRIAASAFAMGGANPHEMIASCWGRAAEIRKTLLRRFGWTTETFASKIEKPLAPINPTSYAGQVDPKNVIVFDAQYDTCIPKSGRDAFWDALGRPERISWPYNHKMAFLTMTPLGLNKMRRKIYTFLEAKL